MTKFLVFTNSGGIKTHLKTSAVTLWEFVSATQIDGISLLADSKVYRLTLTGATIAMVKELNALTKKANESSWTETTYNVDLPDGTVLTSLLVA